MKTRRTRTPRHDIAVAVDGKNLLQEKPNVEQLETMCAEALEEKAMAECGSEENAQKLLSDEKWLGTHLDEVLRSYNVDNGTTTTLTARIRERFRADGEEDG